MPNGPERNRLLADEFLYGPLDRAKPVNERAKLVSSHGGVRSDTTRNNMHKNENEELHGELHEECGVFGMYDFMEQT